MKKTGSHMITRHIEMLEGFRGKKVEAGWFESDRYPAREGRAAGTSVASVARLLEFGGTFMHPGGTSYIETETSGARFVSSEHKGATKTTAPHSITIPPRPFMRLAARNFMSHRLSIQTAIINKVISGSITADQALHQIGMALENEIVDSMKNGNWERNAPSTIARKGFDTPLIESSLMWQSVSSKVS